MYGTEYDFLILWTERELVDEVIRLRDKIRWHRDQRGDDRCYRDNYELYSLLPEGFKRPEADSLVELEQCKKFIASCHDPAIRYVSPQRRIEELEIKVKELEGIIKTYEQ